MGYGVMVCVWWAMCWVWCDGVCVVGMCVGYGVIVCVVGMCVGYGVMVCVWWACGYIPLLVRRQNTEKA